MTDRADGGVAGLVGAGRTWWWTDALNDPWRNPDTHAVVVNRSAQPPPPVLPDTEVAPTAVRPTALIVLVAVISGLLSGGLGGAIGYVAATARERPQVWLGPTTPGSTPPQRSPASVAALVARVMPSVVTVRGAGLQGESLGSGFVLSTNGYLLTNEHVIEEVPDHAVRVRLFDATVLPARVVGRDQESDLAVLKVERQDLRPVEFADSDTVAVGDPVLAIGAQLALDGTVTSGIVSALDRTIETGGLGGVQRYYAAIQTDAAINHGSSGGPLFDLSGRVIGVNSVIKSLGEEDLSAGNIGLAFAIPSNQAARIATEIIDTGKARRTVIGAQLDRTGAAAGGVRLLAVDAHGPAAAAGLRSGDVVIRLGTHMIDVPSDLIALVRRYDPGTVVTVTFRRGATTQTATVTLAADSN